MTQKTKFNMSKELKERKNDSRSFIDKYDDGLIHVIPSGFENDYVLLALDHTGCLILGNFSKEVVLSKFKIKL